MADEITPESKRDEKNSRDEVALELMKFIAQSTGYGKGAPSAGFAGGKSASRSPEEYAESPKFSCRFFKIHFRLNKDSRGCRHE